jgi:hypothetical protein
MTRYIVFVLELVGLAALVAAGWLFSMSVGLVALGLAIFAATFRFDVFEAEVNAGGEKSVRKS